MSEVDLLDLDHWLSKLKTIKVLYLFPEWMQFSLNNLFVDLYVSMEYLKNIVCMYYIITDNRYWYEICNVFDVTHYFC